MPQPPPSPGRTSRPRAPTRPVRRASRRAPTRLLPLALTGALLAACEPVETEISRGRGPLEGVPGAQRGGVNIANPTQLRTVENLSLPEPEQLVVEDRFGRRTLVVREIRHVLFHLYEFVTGADENDFYEQVFADAAKRELAEMGKDPLEELRALRAQRADIITLLSRLPNAEFSPGVIMESMGPRIIRLRLAGPAARDTRYTELWVAMQRGQWRFYWVR
jgi:hypothetical protein